MKNNIIYTVNFTILYFYHPVLSYVDYYHRDGNFLTEQCMLDHYMIKLTTALFCLIKLEHINGECLIVHSLILLLTYYDGRESSTMKWQSEYTYIFFSQSALYTYI